jgi:hypothetical protein
MPSHNIAVQRAGIPPRIAKLPIDERGFPVPRFVEWIDGKPDFRVVDSRFLARAVQQRHCWLCGEPLGKYMAFTIGPMCMINRVNSEPPSHLECAQFAARACPFLTQPLRKRNERDLPENGQQPGGIHLKRNPGCCVVWVTRSYQPFRPFNGGMLFRIGDPVRLEWYAHGRTATCEEITESIESGLPLLRKVAIDEGPRAVADFERQVEIGLALVPA